MIKRIKCLMLIVFAIASGVQAQNEFFHFNSLGYLPNERKVALVSQEFTTFSLVDAQSNEVVFTGNAGEKASQDDVTKTVWKADFSTFTKEGKYYLKTDAGIQSPVFDINASVYRDALVTSMRGFYLWRCGSAVKGEHNGIVYSHEECHMQDGWLDSIGMANQQKDGTGGWHDAGDHGKYVVNAGITVGMMFMAWEHFNPVLKNLDLDLPETAPGFPDYLKELKWETDWLLKMAYPDGSGRVSHKLTRTQFSGFIMPEDDHEKRYFTDWSSAATADFVAMMAQAARYFQPYDQAYADKCLDAARLSYLFLKENPEPKQFRQRFGTGGYQSPDADDRIWAAAEMWETTGEAEFLIDFETRAANLEVLLDQNWDWGNVKNMGLFTYVLSKREGKNPDLLKKVEASVIEVANAIVEAKEKDIFDRPLGSVYYWGCNGTVVRQVLNLYVANRLQKNIKYHETALEAVHHVFGKNAFARSFVTGLGMNPPMHPHDRRSGADNIEAPWPGYIVGGGQTATNWVDEEASYSTNEIAINWQAALVYALAAFQE
ncbi:MAG: glycoside hydrolase family 9 protein [Prolixibacteraceae bacterium]|nr:glycoside hydrolase family 9 protein [Prolixibacteraceae bacterium]